MSAVMGIATQNTGENDGMDMFVVVSDGETTKFLIPADVPEESRDDLLIALGSRLNATESTDPEEIIEDLVYNFPADISVSEPMDTFEEAVQRAQEYMAVVNDFDLDESPLLDAITARNEEETDG